MGTLDFSGLKMKLIASIVAISALALLRAFMSLAEPDSVMDEVRMRWMLILHVTFLFSGLMFAMMNYVGNRAEKPKEHYPAAVLFRCHGPQMRATQGRKRPGWAASAARPSS